MPRADRFFRPDWRNTRIGFRRRTDHRRAAENLNMSGGPQPGFVTIQVAPGEAVLSRATIEFYGADRIRAIVGDPNLKIIAAEDLL